MAQWIFKKWRTKIEGCRCQGEKVDETSWSRCSGECQYKSFNDKETQVGVVELEASQLLVIDLTYWKMDLGMQLYVRKAVSDWNYLKTTDIVLGLSTLRQSLDKKIPRRGLGSPCEVVEIHGMSRGNPRSTVLYCKSKPTAADFLWTTDQIHGFPTDHRSNSLVYHKSCGPFHGPRIILESHLLRWVSCWSSSDRIWPRSCFKNVQFFSY